MEQFKAMLYDYKAFLRMWRAVFFKNEDCQVDWHDVCFLLFLSKEKAGRINLALYYNGECIRGSFCSNIV